MTKLKKLPEIIEHQGSILKLIERNLNVALLKNIHPYEEMDIEAPKKYFVGYIYQVWVNKPNGQKCIYEMFKKHILPCGGRFPVGFDDYNRAYEFYSRWVDKQDFLIIKVGVATK